MFIFRAVEFAATTGYALERATFIYLSASFRDACFSPRCYICARDERGFSLRIEMTSSRCRHAMPASASETLSRRRRLLFYFMLSPMPEEFTASMRRLHCFHEIEPRLFYLIDDADDVFCAMPRRLMS